MKKFRQVDRRKIVELSKRSLKKEEGQKALHHLKNERKFSDEVIDDFDFGYCPEKINHPLCGRIITPIYDIFGNIVAISSRHLDKNHSNRFWHESFDKGSYLYGLLYAKEFIIKYKKVILVEGEFDVAALHSSGFKMTVGVCGSALTVFQVAMLSRYCSNMYVMFDGDKRGKEAIRRTKKIYSKYDLVSYGINFYPVYLPGNKDPDEYIRMEGRKKLQELLKQSKH